MLRETSLSISFPSGLNDEGELSEAVSLRDLRDFGAD